MICMIVALVIAFLHTFALFASHLTPLTAAQQAIAEGLSMPHPQKDGRISTLNSRGAMSAAIDPISQAFITASIVDGTKVLEIGSCYGIVCLEALKQGAKDYTANDIEIKHLKILARRAYESLPETLPCLTLAPGAFPKKVRHLKKNTYDAILISRVMHFMTPQQAADSIKKIFELLKPGGRVYAVMMTPYARAFTAHIDRFEQDYRRGKKFPGFFSSSQTATNANIPSAIVGHHLFFNAPLAHRIFEEHNFIVDRCEEMPLAYSSWIMSLDGRENVGLIAQKPLLPVDDSIP